VKILWATGGRRRASPTRVPVTTCGLTGPKAPVADTWVATMDDAPDRLPPATFLETVGVAGKRVQYRRGAAIFSQGEACAYIWHIESGTVKLSVTSTLGKEAVVGLLGPNEFLGETCLAGLPSHPASATAITPSALVRIAKQQMLRLLHEHHALSGRFIAHMLARNLRIEEDLLDHLFNSSEKRLARALVLLAREGQTPTSAPVIPQLSQETLAAMIGTTRSRVNLFLKRFQRQGFIEYGPGRSLTIHPSLRAVVLRE
jgi:CRP/FNR family cyclic AMP-dependent transcriptional regulator